MNTIETIEEFYKSTVGWVPDSLGNDIGQFNVFKLDSFVGEGAKPAPYRQRDYYKILLVFGSSRVYFTDKILETKKQALAFSNPQIPYRSDDNSQVRSGFFCVFNQQFFHQYGNLNQYAVFWPGGTPIFELTDEQAGKVQLIYERMFEEINSDYIHKYDVLRGLVYELLHFAMKLQPSANREKESGNSSQRIVGLFLELLERQFPIDESHRTITLRYASDFARPLTIHVNHLNRVVKQITGKTTSRIIAERMLREAKILLKHSTWNVSDIAYALGFSEITHFDNFFKKAHGRISFNIQICLIGVGSCLFDVIF